MFGANVHHFPGSCILDVGGAPYISHKNFTFLASSLKPPADGSSYYARRFPRPRPSSFVKIKVKLHLRHFGRTLKINSQRQFEHRKIMQTFENLLLQNYCLLIIKGFG